MERFEKNRILLESLLLWGFWIIITILLTSLLQFPERLVKRAVASFIGFIFIFQVNARFLLPQFFLQKKYSLYITISILTITLTVLFLYHELLPWSDWFRTPPLSVEEEIKRVASNNSDVKWMRESTPMIIAFLGSTLLGIFRFARKKERETIRLEKQKLETELKFLKSQVNPHFLFNALNNIYSLALMQAPQTPESIMQLSEILRYMVYDSNEHKVPLKNEINYIENFVDLKLLKDSRGMNIQMDLEEVGSNRLIAPMLFIPFVENAFKHSKIENLKKGYININLYTTKDTLEFQVVNSIPENTFTKDKVGGVGLENIKKRLELIYPKQHELQINKTDEKFEVVLKIFNS